MREFVISRSESGIRLNKYIKKILPKLPDSLLYKFIRNKNIEVNDKKALPNYILDLNDKISLFLSDDTFTKFEGNATTCILPQGNNDIINKDRIIYEDENIIIYNKEKGLLSQSVKISDNSVNSLLIKYILDNGEIIDKFYRPSVVNRLDRNTSGLIIFAKKYLAARELSLIIANDDIEKYYIAVVNGTVLNDESELTNYYRKDESKNIAIIKDIENKTMLDDKWDIVKLKYKVLKRTNDTTILEIRLITGKSHQIRAQLSHIGNPILCDKKYMTNELYNQNIKKYKEKSQFLTCYKIKFGKFKNDEMKYLDNKMFSIKNDYI